MMKVVGDAFAKYFFFSGYEWYLFLKTENGDLDHLVYIFLLLFKSDDDWEA